MAIQIVKRKNFSAPLPPDFYALKSLTQLDNEKVFVNVVSMQPYDPGMPVFMIGPVCLFFSGSYSRWVIIKWFQKLKERWFPIMYKLEYISIDEHIMG